MGIERGMGRGLATAS